MNKYAKLRTISTVCKILAIVLGLIGFIIGILAAVGVWDNSSALTGVAILGWAWFATAIYILMIFTASEMMDVLLDNVENTRRDNESEL